MATAEKVLSEGMQQLLENPRDVFLDVANLLLRFANNVLNNPQNRKYRQIRVGNPVVEKRLLPVSGAMECLIEMGFEEDGEHFTLPQEALLDRTRKVRDELLHHQQRLMSLVQSAQSPGGATRTTGADAIRAVGPSPQQQNVQEVFRKEAQFFEKLRSSLKLVKLYERSDLQEKARQCIPVTQLQQQAAEKQAATSASSSVDASTELRDTLLLELLAWFKFNFFCWVDAPLCIQCGGTTESVGMAPPDASELRWGASRVENYRCATCGIHTRFPRYNDPEKLLETRRGRCGEWANCFTLCCRAMGFEARYVLDWTDHVWTEVYSEAQQRWLHCDSCENACDKPLVYESGWGKKLTYVIAFANDDIQDVTWRYTTKSTQVLSRRSDCRESWLVRQIVRLRNENQKVLPDSRKDILQRRLVAEIIELMTTRKVDTDECVGRSSGSLAWRQGRGETGSSGIKSSTVIRLSEKEQAKRLIHIKYSCAKNCYVRVSNEELTSGWQHLVYEATAIQRKEERDWNMCYLARTEGATSATITWKFDFSDTSLAVDQVDIQAVSTCFEDGQVLWKLCGGDQCALLPSDGCRTVMSDLGGSRELVVTAELRRGKGDLSWQHTQLFRQSLADRDTFPLDIKVTFKDAP